MILKSWLIVCISVLLAGHFVECRARASPGGKGKEKKFEEFEVKESGGTRQKHIFSVVPVVMVYLVMVVNQKCQRAYSLMLG